MRQSGAVMSNIFDGSNDKPAQDLAFIAKVSAGKTDKSVKHGPATVSYTANIITSLENVLLPDGTRTSEIFAGTPEEGDWYYLEEDGNCVYGHLRFRKNDIVFAKRLDQPKPMSFPETSLPAQLLKHEEACNLVLDEEFAFCVYEALAAGNWVMEGRRWQGNWIKAAKSVAQMRNLNEPYTKFFFTDEVDEQNPEISDPDLIDLFNEIGWELESKIDSEDISLKRERYLRAIKLLEACEGAPTAETPQWAEICLSGLRVPGKSDIMGRAFCAAFSGQMSYSDYIKFWSLFDSDFMD